MIHSKGHRSADSKTCSSATLSTSNSRWLPRDWTRVYILKSSNWPPDQRQGLIWYIIVSLYTLNYHDQIRKQDKSVCITQSHIWTFGSWTLSRWPHYLLHCSHTVCCSRVLALLLETTHSTGITYCLYVYVAPMLYLPAIHKLHRNIFQLINNEYKQYFVVNFWLYS